MTVHRSVDSFLRTSIVAGAHAIHLGDNVLDVWVEDRRSAATLVVFHSALSAAEQLLPIFHGRRVAAEAGVNLIAVSDPSLLSGDVDLAWFFGNRAIGRLRTVLTPVIQHALDELGTENVLIMGGSGGAYAACLYAHDFPGSTVLALNPRLDLERLPFAKVDQYLRVCHGAHSATPRQRIRREFVVERLTDLVGDGLPYDLLIVQNLEDRVFLEHQVMPFMLQMQSDPRLFLRFGRWGRGHVPVPGPVVHDIVWRLSTWGQGVSRFLGAGFVPAAEVSLDTGGTPV